MKKRVIQTEVSPEVYEFVARTAKAKGLSLKEAARSPPRVGDTQWRSIVGSPVRPRLGVQGRQEDGRLEGG